ncbi:Lrp/AsnC family transcriptional regulator [Roseiterribacter gracilis]
MTEAAKSLDQKLLDLLGRNARMSVTELAGKLKLARSTVQARIEKLERNGTIAGYTLKHGVVPGRAVSAHVSIRVRPNGQGDVERKLAKLDGVRTLYSTSGLHDLIAIVAAASTAKLDETIDAIRAIDGVTETVSAILLSTKLER